MDDVTFDVKVADARDQYPECTDGGGEEHFMALVALGQCPYCGMDAQPQDENARGEGRPS